MTYRTITYAVAGRVATITLARPERMNAISLEMPGEIAAAVDAANRDDAVHVIVLAGAGEGFCSGYDLKDFAEAAGERPGSQLGGGAGDARPWDPMADFFGMHEFTQQYMSLWRSYKPTLAKVHGPAVAGGSDIALCCDLVVMAEDAVIGYPPARVWGCPTTAMWVYRLGAEKAKRMLLTGDLIDGREAARLGLVLEAVPRADLDARVSALAERIAAVPKNQLMMQKMMVNQAYDAMGLANTQRFATLFDGITRHSPEGAWFKQRAEQAGFKQAVKERDGGAPIAPGVSRPLAPWTGRK
jgi:enoyl-CoA hydratase